MARPAKASTNLLVRSRRNIHFRIRPKFVFVVCGLLAVVFLYVHLAAKLLTSTGSTTDNNQRLGNDGDILQSAGAPPVFGTHFRLTSTSSNGNTTDVVYKLPPMNTHYQIKGIALLLHACTHTAFKFFSPSVQSCKQCVGLSEELCISRILLERGYAVLAVSSSSPSGCWGGPKDVANVREAIHEFQSILKSKESISGPTRQHNNVVAIGASSGGRFAAQLAAERIATGGSLVMVSALGPTLRERLLAMNTNKNQGMPPIYLAPMPRDVGTTQKTREDYNAMTTTTTMSKAAAFEKDGGKDRPPPRVILDDTTCSPLHVTVNYLNERVPHMTPKMASSIVSTLKKAHHLDSNSHLFVQDPTRSNWRQVLQKECAHEGCLDGMELQPGLSPLAKAFHRAWAVHEYCSEVVSPALDMFEQNIVIR
jgi:hypothetical protein